MCIHVCVCVMEEALTINASWVCGQFEDVFLCGGEPLEDIFSSTECEAIPVLVKGEGGGEVLCWGGTKSVEVGGGGKREREGRGEIEALYVTTKVFN